MNPSDYWIKAVLLLSILVYAIALAGGLISHKLLQYVLIINAFTGLIVILYWVQKQLRITQHIFEAREMIFLGFEAVIVAVAIYSLSSSHVSHWLRVVQYVVFFIQFIFLVMLFLFFLFFKMNKLF